LLLASKTNIKFHENNETKEVLRKKNLKLSNQYIRKVNADNSKYFKIVLGVQTDAMAAKGQHQINVGKKNQTI